MREEHQNLKKLLGVNYKIDFANNSSLDKEPWMASW